MLYSITFDIHNETGLYDGSEQLYAVYAYGGTTSYTFGTTLSRNEVKPFLDIYWGYHSLRFQFGQFYANDDNERGTLTGEEVDIILSKTISTN
jgi:hypothetical protein